MRGNVTFKMLLAVYCLPVRVSISHQSISNHARPPTQLKGGLQGAPFTPSPALYKFASCYMLRTLLLLSTVRFPIFTLKRFSSTMSSSISLPHDEIETLWFGGLNLEPGKPPGMDAVKRWFSKNDTFDISCKYYPPILSNPENTNLLYLNSLKCPTMI
jgi:hypothetical protein